MQTNPQVKHKTTSIWFFTKLDNAIGDVVMAFTKPFTILFGQRPYVCVPEFLLHFIVFELGVAVSNVKIKLGFYRANRKFTYSHKYTSM